MSHARSLRSFRLHPVASIFGPLTLGVLALAARDANAACRPAPGTHPLPGSPAYEAVQDCRWDHRIGLELTAQLGMGMGFDTGADTFELVADGQGQRLAPGLGINVALGWRPTPAFSIGGHLYYQYSAANGLNTTPRPASGMSTSGSTTMTTDATFTPTGGHTDLVSAGIYARLYIGALVHARRIEPWIGVGFDWPSVGWVATQVHTDAVTETSVMGIPVSRSPQSLDGTLQHTVSAVSIPFSAGFDFNVSPELSLGVTGTVSLWFPYSQCGSRATFSVSNNGDTQVICNETLTAAGLTPNYSVTPMLFIAGEARFLAPW